MTTSQSLGGQATAKILREQALEGYYLNPKKCLTCDGTIQVKNDQKVSQVKKKDILQPLMLSIIFERKKDKKKNHQK